jgi:hypothetical protein
MPEENDGLSEAQQRMYAESIRDSQEHERRIYTMENWLMATLVAINGAPVIAMLDSELGTFHLLASGLFLLGVVLAVVSGFTAMLQADALATVHFLRGVFQRRKLPKDFEEDHSSSEKASERHGTRKRILMYLSLGAFVAGAVCSGWATLKKDPATSIKIELSV